MLLKARESLVCCHFAERVRAMGCRLAHLVRGHVSLSRGEEVLGEVAIASSLLQIQWLGYRLLGTSL